MHHHLAGLANSLFLFLSSGVRIVRFVAGQNGREDLKRTTRLDGVVTVADTANGMMTLDTQFEAVSQAAGGDVIILSKTDVVEPEAVAVTETRLRGLNPTAPIVKTIRSENAYKHIWGLSGVRHGVTPTEALDWLQMPNSVLIDPLQSLSGLAPKPTDSASFSPHDNRIRSVSIVVDDWLTGLVALRGPNLLRVKGLVFLQGIEAPFVFHGVQHIFDDPVPIKDWDQSDRRGRIVIIARDMSERQLRRYLRPLVAAIRTASRRNSSVSLFAIPYLLHSKHCS